MAVGTAGLCCCRAAGAAKGAAAAAAAADPKADSCGALPGTDSISCTSAVAVAAGLAVAAAGRLAASNTFVASAAPTAAASRRGDGEGGRSASKYSVTALYSGRCCCCCCCCCFLTSWLVAVPAVRLSCCSWGPAGASRADVPWLCPALAWRTCWSDPAVLPAAARPGMTARISCGLNSSCSGTCCCCWCGPTRLLYLADSPARGERGPDS